MCVVCRKRFATRQDFEQHKHPTCQICNKRVVALNEHLQSHPRCHRCGEYFKTEAKLRLHIDTDHTIIPSSQMEKCPICHERIKSRYLPSHMRDHHPRDRQRSRSPQLDLSDPSDDDNRSLNDRSPDADSDYISASSLSAGEATASASQSDNGGKRSPSDDDGGRKRARYGSDVSVSSDDARRRKRARSTELSDDRFSAGDSDVSASSDDATRRKRARSTELSDDGLSERSSDDATRRKRARSTELSDDRSSVKSISTLSAGREVVPVDYSFSEDEIECPKCNLKFPSQALLNSHMKEHKRRHVCHHCGKHFASAKMLNRHMQTHSEEAGPSDTFQCEICKDILRTKEGYLKHMENHKKHECKVCAAQFNSAVDRDMHMSMNHPLCTICDIAFTTTEEYLRHNQREHPRNHKYDGPGLSSESEDRASDEDSLEAEDRLFHKHINCVTIERFMEIRNLIEQDLFDTLANDEELLEALQIIFKGAIKGYIPLCTPQRMVLTKPMKNLIYRFGRRPSATLLMRNKRDLKQLFRVLWQSVDTVIKSYNKYV